MRAAPFLSSDFTPIPLFYTTNACKQEYHFTVFNVSCDGTTIISLPGAALSARRQSKRFCPLYRVLAQRSTDSRSCLCDALSVSSYRSVLIAPPVPVNGNQVITTRTKGNRQAPNYCVANSTVSNVGAHLWWRGVSSSGEVQSFSKITEPCAQGVLQGTPRNAETRKSSFHAHVYSCLPSVGTSSGHIIRLIVPANSNLVPSGLGLRPERMHDYSGF